jgi:hypothetical protein
VSDGERTESGLPLERAERVLDDLLARAREKAVRAVALGREEAEDIMAEARQLRERPAD